MKFSDSHRTIIRVNNNEIAPNNTFVIPRRTTPKFMGVSFDGMVGTIISDIGDEAFAYCTTLSSVEIPETVLSIGMGAFKHCKNLHTVSLPRGLSKIKFSTFFSCRSLININIPTSAKEIDDFAFYNCSSLTSINLPYGITEIRDSTFEGCSSLTHINIPNGVTRIGEKAFFQCSSLETVNLPRSLKLIGKLAFSGCSSLEEIIIPEGVTEISDFAFEGCYNLRRVKLPDSVKRIGRYAFRGCRELTSISLPKELECFVFQCFMDCTKLRVIFFPSAIQTIILVYESNDNALAKYFVIPDDEFDRIKQLLPLYVQFKARRQSIYELSIDLIEREVRAIAPIPQLNALYNVRFCSGHLLSEDSLGQINSYLNYIHPLYQDAKKEILDLRFPTEELELDDFHVLLKNAVKLQKNKILKIFSKDSDKDNKAPAYSPLFFEEHGADRKDITPVVVCSEFLADFSV